MAAAEGLAAHARGRGRRSLKGQALNYRPFVIVVVLMALAVLALQFTVNVEVADQPGIREALPPQLGAWQGA